MNNKIQTTQPNNLALANTVEAQKLMPILEEYSTLYKNEIKNPELKKKNLLLFANELSKVTINNRPAIEVATPSSIREVALRVLTEDIDLSKKQAVIIPYGNNLTLQKEFYGNVALVKQQYGDKIEFRTQVVYPKDEFSIKKNGLGFGIDEYTHDTKPENMVTTNASGYKTTATPTFVYTYVVDLTVNKVINSNCFSYQRCYDSWTQSGIKQTHKKFPADMMIKTIENYIATRMYNKSNTNPNLSIVEDFEIESYDNNEEVIDVSSFNDFEPKEKVSVKKTTKEKKEKVEKIEKVESIEPILNPEVVIEQEPEVEFAPDFEFVEKEETFVQENPQQEDNYYNGGFEIPREEDEYLPDFLMDEPEQVEETEKIVSYMDWKNNYSKTGEWELVPQTYDALNKTTKIRRK